MAVGSNEAGVRVRRLRKELGLTQSAFAEKIGVKGGVVSAWENGSAPVPYGRMKIICDAFRVNEKWLLNGVGDVFAVARKRESPNREHAIEYVCRLFDKTPEDARRDAVEFLREILARCEDQLDDSYDDAGAYLDDKNLKIASAEDDFDDGSGHARRVEAFNDDEYDFD